nr:ATP-binding cassette domain-containing protein [Enterovibrio nigricans]
MFSRQSLPSPNLSKPALLLQDAKVRIVSGATSGILSGWFSAPAAQESVSVLNGINLSVPTGAWYMLVGPSGCGKSTLLSVLNNLTPLSSGQALKFGVPVDCWCRKWECCPGTRTALFFKHRPYLSSSPRWKTSAWVSNAAKNAHCRKNSKRPCR